MVSGKTHTPDVLLYFFLFGKQTSPVIGKGHRESHLRTHSLHLLLAMCITLETDLGQSQPRKNIELGYKCESCQYFSQLQAPIKYLEMSTFISSYYHYHRMRIVAGI